MDFHPLLSYLYKGQQERLSAVADEITDKEGVMILVSNVF